jgi:hypothetical protein
LEGKSADWLKEEMDRLQAMEKSDVKEGRVSGAVYHVSLFIICEQVGLLIHSCGQ